MIIYVAGPFRGRTAWQVTQNVRAAEIVAFEVAQAGHVPMCPHTMYGHFDGELTDEFWLNATMQLLKRCDAIVMVNGWRHSSGSKAEYQCAKNLGMPTFCAVARSNAAHGALWDFSGESDVML